MYVPVAGANRNFAGVVPVDFKFVKTVLRKINGVSVMGLPGFVPIVNA